MVRRVSFFSLIILLLGAVSWQSPISSTFDSLRQAEAAAKNASAAQSDEPAPFPEASKGDDPEKGGDGNIMPNAPWPIGGGDASFTNGVYNCAGTSYSYNVVNGPPNVCGELHITRNGNPETTGGWICTNASGSATKGPWTVSTNQTGTNIFILWPDGTRTSGGETKVDDLSKPEAFINPGYPGSFSGTATDAQWGSGFDSWTTVRVTFQNKTNGLHWNGSGYGSFSPVPFPATRNGSGSSITWSITPPPAGHHVSGNQYEWCVEANDRCSYSLKKCVTFTY